MCNQKLVPGAELVPHPFFEDRKICTRPDCAGDHIAELNKMDRGQCMLCRSVGRVLLCNNRDDKEKRCPWALCLGCCFCESSCFHDIIALAILLTGIIINLQIRMQVKRCS